MTVNKAGYTHKVQRQSLLDLKMFVANGGDGGWSPTQPLNRGENVDKVFY